jgi:hypothetical protein
VALFSIQKPSKKTPKHNFGRLTIQEPVFLCLIQNLNLKAVALGMATAIVLEDR